MTKTKIINWLTDTMRPFRDFVDNHHSDPLLWTAFVLIGLVTFSVVYHILNKNN